jgi:hypothetical protein
MGNIMNGNQSKKKCFPLTIGMILLVGVIASACSDASETTPTLSPEIIQTRAVVTFVLGLTETAAALPTDTPTGTPTATSTLTPTTTYTPTATDTQVLPTDSCYSLAFIKDINIPDNTEMTTGQVFTKTWRVNNNGSCAWESGFKVIFTSGDAMDGTPFTLTEDVDPGGSIEVSVDLTAPSTVGSYQGNWRMTNEGGVFFGDNFYVLIAVVDHTPTESPSATETQTPEVSENATETSAP